MRLPLGSAFGQDYACGKGGHAEERWADQQAGRVGDHVRVCLICASPNALDLWSQRMGGKGAGHQGTVTCPLMQQWDPKQRPKASALLSRSHKDASSGKKSKLAATLLPELLMQLTACRRNARHRMRLI